MDVQNGQSRIITAMETMEGAGVTVYRTIGTPALRSHDPFIMMDHISSDNSEEYIAGFPSHPHRGFNTFTYMIDGDMEHKDSMGNTGNLGPGGAQWMKAASGVIHSEMPKQENGLLRGFQLWINLPAINKFDAPEYQEYKSENLPVVEDTDYRVKVIIGGFDGDLSPIVDEITHVSYFDVEVKPNKYFNYTLPEEHNSFLYVFEGSGHLTEQPNGQIVETHELVILSDGNNHFSFNSGEQGARFLLVSGMPINESIEQYGPFVMNTRKEIDEAMHDYQSNNFVRDRAWINRNKK
jgi:quercetin 2,3-dioxygenase